MTKRDKPAMSEEEFEKAIKELAQKEFATDGNIQVSVSNAGPALKNVQSRPDIMRMKDIFTISMNWKRAIPAGLPSPFSYKNSEN